MTELQVEDKYVVKLKTGYMDLATFGDDEKYLYGSSEPNEKWRTHIPVSLKRKDDNSFFIDTRNADWLEYVWINIEVTVTDIYKPIKNLAHNLFESIDIICTTSGLHIWRVDNYVLDFLANFNADIHYMKNINLPNMCEPGIYCLCFPLPLSAPIPIDILPNDALYIKYILRQILGIENIKINMCANYRLVDEKIRQKNLMLTRRITIETYDTRYIETIPDLQPCFDIHFCSTKALLFAAKVKDSYSEYRNIFDTVGLAYGEAIRLWQPMNFYTFIQPYFHAKVNNGEPIGLYSYANGKIDEVDTVASIYLGRLYCSFLPKLNAKITNPKEYEFVCVSITRKVWYAHPDGTFGCLTL